jgi:hypothetical protein
MVYFQTKNPYLGKFWCALDWKMFIYFMVFGLFKEIWDILLPFGTFCINLVNFSSFGIMYREKSGNLVWRIPCLSRWSGADFMKQFSAKMYG